MPTRARINIELPNEEYKSIYIHNDGYPSYIGPLLLENYNTKEKINKLMSLGDASILSESTEQSDLIKQYGFDYFENKNFQKLNKKIQNKLIRENKKYCKFYHRDRKEPINDTKAIITKEPKTEAYTYIFRHNQWYLYNEPNPDNLTFIPLNSINLNEF